MAFGRLARSPKPTPLSEINMTPLIDVMLVLLVIFMVTAPLMGSRLKLDLPAAEGTSNRDVPDGFAVAVDADGRIFVDDAPVDLAGLRTRVTALAERNPDAEVQLRADQAVPYGRVVELIGTVQAGGLSRIGFVAQPPAAAASR